MPDKLENKLDNCTFQTEDIRYIISHLNKNKSTYFSPRLLKLVSAYSNLLYWHMYLINVLMWDISPKNLK